MWTIFSEEKGHLQGDPLKVWIIFWITVLKDSNLELIYFSGLNIKTVLIWFNNNQNQKYFFRFDMVWEKQSIYIYSLGSGEVPHIIWARSVQPFWLLLDTNIHCLSVCLFVCLYPINAKTAEPIRPKFFVGPNMGHVRNDYKWLKF